MEFNSIQDIEKTLTENNKKIFGNFSKIQNLMEENKKLITELTDLNQQKMQKLLQEMQDRFFTQAKEVESLLGSTGKRKSQKKYFGNCQGRFKKIENWKFRKS